MTVPFIFLSSLLLLANQIVIAQRRKIWIGWAWSMDGAGKPFEATFKNFDEIPVFLPLINRGFHARNHRSLAIWALVFSCKAPYLCASFSQGFRYGRTHVESLMGADMVVLPEPLSNDDPGLLDACEPLGI